MDTLSKEARSARMALVRGKNTKPEMTVRRLVHALGYRYRLHARTLPGTPDLVFPARHKVLFVHGCFWHRHGVRCSLTRLPKTRLDFWASKLEANRKRDDKNRRSLRATGWKVLTVWECQLKDSAALKSRINKFLENE
ncbi:MAG: DNA mismatch endonuclease Vsr [Bryobacterales bacterium]|nr:DNA mismatch endonuclease Vsr [Bryobacterales bacterium]